MKNSSQNILFLLFALSLILKTNLAYCAEPAVQTNVETSSVLGMKPGLSVVNTKHDQQNWTSQLYIPKRIKLFDSHPAIVLLLHGAGGSGITMLDQNRWQAKSELEGFIALAPDGLPASPGNEVEFLTNPRVWNSGQLPEASVRAQVDDISFVKTLVAQVEKMLKLDSPFWFVTGHSNGAGLTFRLALEFPEQWQAIAPVSGPLAVPAVKLPKPVPTLYILGTLDPLQPLRGGNVFSPWGTMQTTPVDKIVGYWCDANGCKPIPESTDESEVLLTREYALKADQPIIKTIYVKGHGHSWPGGNHGPVPPLFQPFVGPVKTDFLATDQIWMFFVSQLPAQTDFVSLKSEN